MRFENREAKQRKFAAAENHKNGGYGNSGTTKHLIILSIYDVNLIEEMNYIVWWYTYTPVDYTEGQL